MTELYWITRLDAFIFVLVVMILLGVVLFSWNGMRLDDTNEDYKPDAPKRKSYKRNMKMIAIITFMSLIAVAFIPSTKNALLIYGVGGTVDYIQGNDTAKQIPDKCLKAIDKYLDSFNEDDNE